jgi:predicted MPP superfamily phosphohydrolase
VELDKMNEKKKWSDWLWDLWCLISLVGIWPRFIEPKLLDISKFTLSISNLSSELDGLTILQFSDLHWNCSFSNFLRKKLITKVKRLNPDIIVFTGDWICRSKLEDKVRFKNFLNQFYAPLGCFTVFGNHDYAQFVTVSETGDYDVDDFSDSSNLAKGFSRLFNPIQLTGKITDFAKSVEFHPELCEFLQDTPFRLLDNETIQVSHQNKQINVCGLGEYSLGRCNPEKTFRNYDHSCPGVVLSHHPDTIEILKTYPGDLILSGHTHGGQVNLPFFWEKFTQIEHKKYKSGLKTIGKKWAYINRGIGSVMHFRWFAKPELTLITLKSKS